MHIRSCCSLLVGLALASLVGCGADDPSCPSVEGSYEPLYIPLSGSCGTIERPNRVPFEGGRNGVNTIIERRVNSNITTEIVMKGCSVRMTQTVTDNEARVASLIDGPTIDIMSETELQGQVSMTVFDDEGAVSCSGTYDAVFTKNTQIIGGAAQ